MILSVGDVALLPHLDGRLLSGRIVRGGRADSHGRSSFVLEFGDVNRSSSLRGAGKIARGTHKGKVEGIPVLVIQEQSTRRLSAPASRVAEPQTTSSLRRYIGSLVHSGNALAGN